MKKEETLNKILSKYLKNNKNITNILGDFKIGKQLGAGGTSVVREATLNGKEYAIKFLHENIANKETTAFKRFKQAYLNIANIKDSRVVLSQIHIDTLKINDDIILPYTIMPKADMTLKDWHKKAHEKGKMTFEVFEQSFTSIINVVHGIHKDNIIHRDIKPENFFIIDNQLMLGDFDISKFLDESHINLIETKKGDRLANFAYSAPEQFQQGIKFEDITKSADWFAVGQVLYWLITGNTLRGQEQINLQTFDKKYVKYESLIRKLLEQNPQNRVSSYEEIQKYLKEKNKKYLYWQDSLRQYEDNIIEKYTLGSGIHGYKDLDDIQEIMDDLKIYYDFCKKYENPMKKHSLKWREGHRTYNMRGDIEKTSTCDRCWQLGDFEVKIKSIWFVYNSTFGSSFLMIETDFLEPIGVNKNATYKYSNFEEFGIYKNKFITLDEYDSGWAKIDGKRVNIKGKAKRGMRNIKPTLYFIAPEVCSIHNIEIDGLLDSILEQYKKQKFVDSELLSYLTEIPRQRNFYSREYI